MPSPKLRLQTTTLWSYPSQHYGKREQGSSAYRGATPSWVIWNLLRRYTEPGELVVDPMAGSGTTLDVAVDLEREALGFDLQSLREDILEEDARDLPLRDAVVDFVFLDPPYGKNLKYSGKANCIGELDAHEEAYFQAMDKVFREAWRVLKPGRHLAVYACDIWSRRSFVPIGARFAHLLAQCFDLVDHIAVARGNKDLKKGNYHKAAEETNFFLRGFNHLLIARKPRASRAARSYRKRGRVGKR